MIYDARGNPYEMAVVRQEIEREAFYAQTVTQREGLGSGLTPKRLTGIWQEADEGRPQQLQALLDDVLDKDPHLFGELQKRKLAVTTRPVRLIAADNSRKAKKARDYCQELLDELPDFEDALDALLEAVYRGYSLVELVWDFSEGVSLTELRPWDARLFQVDRDDPHTLRRLDKADMSEGLPLESGKWIQHRYKALSGLPVRAGLGRIVTWYHCFKQWALRDWLRFSELFGTPPRIAKYPPGISPEDRAVLKRAVEKFGRNLAALVPEDSSLEFPSTGSISASSDLYERLVSLCNREQSKAVCGGTLTAESGDKGARSLGEVHERGLMLLSSADARALERTLRRDVLLPAVRFQLGEGYLVPRLEIDVEDLKVLAERLKVLKDIGMEIPAAWVYQRFGVPEPEDGEVVLGGSAKAAQPSGGEALRGELTGKKKAFGSLEMYL